MVIKPLIPITFFVGLIVLAAWVVFSLASPRVYVNEHIVVIGRGNETISVSIGGPNPLAISLFFVIALAVITLLVLGFVFRQKNRWLAFTLAGVLLTGFSISWAYSLGGFLLPVGIILLVVSLRKLARYNKYKDRVNSV